MIMKKLLNTLTLLSSGLDRTQTEDTTADDELGVSRSKEEAADKRDTLDATSLPDSARRYDMSY